MAARNKVGLPPGRNIWSGHPMLYGISPSLLPQPADWPDNAWICGQWVQPVHEWEAPSNAARIFYPRETRRFTWDSAVCWASTTASCSIS